MSTIKLIVKGGSVNPGTVGPALGGKNLNMGQVVTQINSLTEKHKGQTVRVIIRIDDQTKQLDIQVKGTPAADLLKKAAKIDKGSSVPNRDKVASLSKEALMKIAEEKKEDLNAFTPQAAFQILAGTARSMGITITQ